MSGGATIFGSGGGVLYGTDGSGKPTQILEDAQGLRTSLALSDGNVLKSPGVLGVTSPSGVSLLGVNDYRYAEVTSADLSGPAAYEIVRANYRKLLFSSLVRVGASFSSPLLENSGNRGFYLWVLVTAITGGKTFDVYMTLTSPTPGVGDQAMKLNTAAIGATGGFLYKVYPDGDVADAVVLATKNRPAPRVFYFGIVHSDAAASYTYSAYAEFII